MVTITTNGIMKDNLPCLVVDVVKKERERTKADVPALVSHEFATHAPQIIKEHFRICMQNAVLNVHPSSTSLISNLQHQLYLKIKNDPESQIIDFVIWDALKKKWSMVQEIDDDEDIFEEATTKVLAEIQGKTWVPITDDLHKMKFAYNDILKRRCDTGAEYEYHIQQMENYMNNQIVWKS
ncbi:hypothetical protein Tco_1405666 [Tanacetum coccineum]